MLAIRRAEAADAQAIGAVFDAAVREGWRYLGELAARPMFPPEEWDDEVAKHAPPNALLVATNEANWVIGFVAVHPAEGEMYLLFVHPDHAGLGVGRALFGGRARGAAVGRLPRSLSLHARAERAGDRRLRSRAMARYASPSFAASTSGSRDW
jgi:GNAT superfamily N-acetyltransferase